MSWLDKYFTKGVTAVQAGGIAVPAEPTINFVGATIADDPSNGRTTITITGAAPSGTGIPHVVGGSYLGAASLISLTADVSGVLPNANQFPASLVVSALNIDWSAAGVFTKTLAGGANTFTFSNATDGYTIIVFVTGAASTLTWPTVKWAGGVAPTQTASGLDVYTFVKAGSVIVGSVVQAMA